MANATIEMVTDAGNDERKLTQKILTHMKDPSAAAGLWIVVWNLGQITKYCRIIGKVTINRILEKPSAICEYLIAPE